MKKAADHPTTKSDPDPAILSLGSLGVQFLDTTWRMAVPVIFFVIFGILADKHFNTKPWLTLLSLVFGFAGAILLVKREIETAKRSNT